MEAGSESKPCVFFLICHAGLLAAVAEGPRATEQFAAVVAVFVAALTASARAQDISARFLEQLVGRLQQVRVPRFAPDPSLAWCWKSLDPTWQTHRRCPVTAGRRRSFSPAPCRRCVKRPQAVVTPVDARGCCCLLAHAGVHSCRRPGVPQPYHAAGLLLQCWPSGCRLHVQVQAVVGSQAAAARHKHSRMCSCALGQQGQRHAAGAGIASGGLSSCCHSLCFVKDHTCRYLVALHTSVAGCFQAACLMAVANLTFASFPPACFACPPTHPCTHPPVLQCAG